jgi:hypothetical protein
MNSGLQKRLYDIEVMPPAAVWQKLSLSIDEINADNILSEKVLDTELIPPVTAWQNISIAIGVAEKKEPTKRGTVINFKRLAIAAIFIGLVVTAWVLFKPGNQTAAGLVDTPTEENPKRDTNNATQKIELAKEKDIPVTTSVATINPQTTFTKRKPQTSARSNDVVTAQLITDQPAALANGLAGKSFDQPIDDLSLVTADQHYMTMVNANGRLVKIPTQLAHLAPHLQDKPVAEDIHEIMFGEGTYWKETLSEWRKKIVSLPVSSGDAFTSFIELLKTVQDK